MYSVRITSTSDRELPAADYGPALTWDRLTEVLRREVSPEAAALFAEPVADPRQGQTHWHVTADEDPKPFSALSGAEQAKLTKDLEGLRQRINDYADRLQSLGGEGNLRLAAALKGMQDVPNFNSHLWSVGGAPLLTGWGRSAPAVARRASAIVVRQQAPPSVPASAGIVIVGTTTGPMAGAAVGSGSSSAPPKWLVPLLWLLFAGLFAAILYLLIAACAIDLPILRHFYDRCPWGTSARPLEPLIAKNDDLRERIRQAESDLAQHANDCTASTAGPTDRQSTQRGPNSGTNVAPDRTETQRRVDEEHGTHGKLDITLGWNGREDLDLHVYCPNGGHLYHTDKHACGGELQIDKNSNSAAIETTPVEHATWSTEPPPGDYRVVVVLYGNNGEAPRAVPYTVVITDGDTKKEYSGVADTVQKPQTVVEFTR